jgi:hemerythrin-like domain-containing protein
MVGVRIGGKHLAGFNQPIELLKDCHRRIEHFLEVLRNVVELFGEAELSEEGRRALEASLDYFAHAAPRHTADEEESLFPRMRRSHDAETCAVMAELDRLEADHRRADERHAQVDQLGRKWLAAGSLDEHDRATMRALLDDLVALYDAHIRLEEQRVFEVASRALDQDDLSAVGVEMRRRRFGP